MIDNRKVQLMTKIVTYEKANGNQEIKLNHYSKKTYVALKLLDTIVSATVTFGLASSLYAAYLLMSAINKGIVPDYLKIIHNIAVVYAVFMAISIVWCLIYFSKNYTQVSKNIEKYKENVMELQKYYSTEKKIVITGIAEFYSDEEWMKSSKE